METDAEVHDSLTCVECERTASGTETLGWRGYDAGDEVVILCRACAEREFGE